MVRTILELNNEWMFKDSFEEKFISPDFDDSDFQKIRLPHNNRDIPYNYFDEKEYQFVSCYRKKFYITEAYKEKYFLLDFEGVMNYAKVYLNGEYVGEHKGGYTPFTLDITDYVRFEETNVLAVMVDSGEKTDIPPFGNVLDYLTYGGIYRKVRIRIVEEIYIDNMFIKTKNVMEDLKELEADIYLNNKKHDSGKVKLEICLKKSDQIVKKVTKDLLSISSGINKVSIEMDHLSGIELWEIDNPSVYHLDVILLKNDDTIDHTDIRFGFREARFTGNGFFLNGKKLKLIGLNRHQAFPYVGYAMPARVQKKDADILKYELGLNIVRTSHYPQSRHFLDRCDEIGLLVFEEIPGWQHIGDQEWKEIAYNNVKEMIQRDWNHPSIILWGVRINESMDDHDFYMRTNRIAKELDGTRQTGGVRHLPGSELLEDVFTFNDFIHVGHNVPLRDQREATKLDYSVPYLVTEYNGHMYPTKRFDHEERLIEQTLRHIRVINAARIDEHISGCIGWCAFDYNTHYEFGSGDRICYHGVMDMFRIPKFAAYAYQSQSNPEKQAVLEPLTLWTRGERDGCGISPLIVLTNCDYIEMFIGGNLAGSYYPDQQKYPGLEHPPISINVNMGEWGCKWNSGEFIGYVNGEKVVKKIFAKNPVAEKLLAIADDINLSSKEMDATRVVFKLVDQAENIIPYINEYIKFSISGPGEIIGPKETALIGGCIAVWVKTVGESGKIILSAACSRFEANDICISVD